MTRPATKRQSLALDLELLERDLERGKPLFRRKIGKVRNLDGSGHKGLADLAPPSSIAPSIDAGEPVLKARKKGGRAEESKVETAEEKEIREADEKRIAARPGIMEELTKELK